ncbi:MAG: serine/threonine-protein kinase [Myxococcota bacterium]|nr:serine/threonine-protein kinase [Myxococcota bacterium]
MTSSDHLRLVDPPEEPVDPLIGQTIDGRYMIEGRLGEGGMGVVYATKHVVLGKALAMKVLRADVSKDQEIMQRFRQEAQSASAIGSQHIIDISDFGKLPDGATYFIMEFLDGKELTKVIEEEQPIDPTRLAHVAKQLCDALGAAHERGIVHRDMKPDNVFLVKRGKDPDFVKVLDFGIAKVGGASSKLTKAGQVFGTPHYMSPEQCAGQSVDSRTDIYALGVILYELACGKVPFDADNLMGILTKHIYEQPIPLHQLPPPVDVPSGLEAVILKCLAKSTDQRYQTMAEVKADLEAWEAGQTPGAVMDAVDRSTGGHRVDPTGRHSALQVGVGGEQPEEGSKLPIVLGAVVGLLALVATGLLAYFLVLAPEEPETPPIASQPVIETPVEEVEEPEEEAEVLETAEEMTEEAAAAAPKIRVVSAPEGAEVLLVEGEDEIILGNTPYEIDRPEQGTRTRLLLRQPGYEAQTIVLSYLTTEELTVNLREERRAGRRSGRSRSRSRSGAAQQQPQQEQPQQQAEPQQQQQQRQGRSGGIGGEVLDPWAR